MNTQTLLKHYVAIKRSIEQKQNEANHWRDRLAKALLNNGELSGAKLIKVRKTKVRSQRQKVILNDFHWHTSCLPSLEQQILC